MRRLAEIPVCVVVALGAAGCGSTEPENAEVTITVDGIDVDRPEPDPEKAAATLAEKKEKWLDDNGMLREEFNRGTANRAMASMEFESISINHPGTPAGDESAAIAESLSEGQP